MGEAGEDVKMSTKAREMIPFSFECKNLAKMAVYNLWEQCHTNSLKVGHTPALVLHANHKPTLVAIELDKFIDLCFDRWELQNKGKIK